MSGFIAGGVLGASMALMIVPQMRSETRERLMAGGQQLSRVARGVVKRSRDEVEDIIDELKN